MSEAERRRKYVRNRVLIETARVLSPTFHDAVVFLSGAQLELLRNVTQYLNRQETYVSEYNPGYYLTPPTADYDDILEIVADMEEVLMGNPNTIWGYSERLVDRISEYGSGTNDLWVVHGSVPAGELWIVHNLYVLHEADAAKQLQIYTQGGGEFYYLVDLPSASPIVYHRWDGTLILAEDDDLVARVVAPGDGKLVEFGIYGYKMIVPAL